MKLGTKMDSHIKREANVMSKLKHVSLLLGVLGYSIPPSTNTNIVLNLQKHIIPLLSVSQTQIPPQIFIVMPLCQGNERELGTLRLP